MASFQFASIEAYALSPSTLAGPKARSASDIVQELERVPAHCRHVPRPEPPAIVFGTTAGLREKLKARPRDSRGQQQRKDALVLIALIFSYPDRWDRADPKSVVPWIKAVTEYCQRLWPGIVAAVVLHCDEAQPHLHVLVHNHGKSVKPIHPGFRAGDSAYERALSRGASPMAANKIRKSEHRRALTSFLDHHFSHVSSVFGFARKSARPRARIGRQAALSMQEARNARDPVDEVLAKANKLAVRAGVQALHPSIAEVAKREVNILSAIAFRERMECTPEVELAGAIRPEVATTTNKTKKKLQGALGRLLETRPGLVQFVRGCCQEGVAVIPYFKEGKITGISFRVGAHGCAGSSLGQRFAWPSLSKALGFDPANHEHLAALAHSDLAATVMESKIETVLEPDGPISDDGSGGAARGRRPSGRAKRALPLTVTEGTTGREHRWAKSNRLAIRESEHRVSVVDPVVDVLVYSLKLAANRGWTAVRLTSLTEVLEEVRKTLMRWAVKLGVVLRLVARDAPAPVTGGDPRKSLPSSVGRQFPRPSPSSVETGRVAPRKVAKVARLPDEVERVWTPPIVVGESEAESGIEEEAVWHPEGAETQPRVPMRKMR